jgi:hypothetical protein
MSWRKFLGAAAWAGRRRVRCQIFIDFSPGREDVFRLPEFPENHSRLAEADSCESIDGMYHARNSRLTACRGR